MNRRRAMAMTLGSLGLSVIWPAAVEVNRPAPFRVPDAANRIRQLSEFAGRNVVLEWTSPRVRSSARNIKAA